MRRSCNSRFDRKERSEESRYDHRLHGVLLVSCGYFCTEVGQLLGQAATTVQRCGGRFERGSLDGLRECDRLGRPRALDVAMASRGGRLAQDITRILIRGRLVGWIAAVSEHLRKNYGVRLGVRQCQRLFGQMGFRLRKPCSQVAPV